MKHNPTQKFFAELAGTAILVFMGCGSAMVLGCDTTGGHLAVALAFGLAIVATAYVIGGVSGCHINPAVSLAMLIHKKMTVTEFVYYVVAQVIGALIGAGLLKAVEAFGVTDLTGAIGSNGVANVGIFGAIVVEVLLTFIFIFTILGVTSDEKKGNVAGLVIGLTLAFVHIVGIPLTGTSVNPARSLGPAILAGGSALADVWVFIVAPFAGAALAALAYFGFKEKKSKKKQK